jgi:hypothetical protein
MTDADNFEKEIIYSDMTGDLRPDLEMLGIDEVDRGVCEDSYENRSILRLQKMSWNVIYDDLGQPTGLIQALSHEMRSAKSKATIEDRKAILEDDRDHNSNYLTEEALLIEEASDTLVPLWVIGQTRTWLRIRQGREKNPALAPQWETAPHRCTYIKADGVRCMLWCSGRKTDMSLCRVHLGSKSGNLAGAVQKARTRAYQAAPAALEILEQLMESAESEPVKLKAATEILDRAGVRGGVEIDAKIDINERPSEDLIRERLLRLVPQVSKELLPELEMLTDETEDRNRFEKEDNRQEDHDGVPVELPEQSTDK